MKKILIILAICLFALPVWATDYYAQSDAAIGTATLWDTNPAGGGDDLTWTGSHADHTFYANNHTITVDADCTLGVIRNDAGTGTAGGKFVTSGTRTLTITTAVTGAVTLLELGGDLTLTLTAGTGGSAANARCIDMIGNYDLVLLGGGTLTGGSGSASAAAVYRINSLSALTIGTDVAPFTIQAGALGRGVYNAAAGNSLVTIYANVTSGAGVNAWGIDNGSTGTMAVFGTIKGNTGAVGLRCTSTGVVTLTGILDNTGQYAATDCGSTLTYTPTSAQYIKYGSTEYPTGLAAENIKAGVVSGSVTGTASAGGVSAW